MKIKYLNKKNSGLTLIEVLIALAIISIAVTAIIKATTQNIRVTTHLQNKTVALWIAKSMTNEMRLNAKRLIGSQNKLSRPIYFLDHTWFVNAEKQETPNPHIDKIMVAVYLHDPEVDEEQLPLARIESYVYQSQL
ncbi:MAG: type II secretion system minor pseudopilin GspI [Gammaproteobacteria bacterium]|nr:type II secretion system minor pseudopilin GspI [Gammaproteobacteria bacterium]